MASIFSSPNEQLKRACQELKIPVSRFQDDVERIKAWMQTQPHLPDPCEEDGLLYENFLLRCKGSVEVAKQSLDFYCSMRAPVPEFYANRDPCGPEFTTLLDIQKAVVLKDLTSKGYRVTIYRLNTVENMAAFSCEDMIKWWFLDEDVLLKEDINLGEIYVHDMKHITLGHVVKISAAVLHKGIVCALNGYKARVKGIHVINPPAVAEMLLNLVRRILPVKLKSRLCVHANMESLHQYVDREILPKDFGGDQGSFQGLADAWVKEIQSRRDWILQKDVRCQVDESKRPGKSFNISDTFGVEGSFKQLSVD